MLLEKIVEIIEFTDTDSISEALETFNKCGIVAGTAFPYLDVIFDNAPEQLSNKLKQIGFKGTIEITKINTKRIKNSYAVYDSTRYSQIDAQSWLETDKTSN